MWDQDEETAIRSPHGGPKITWGGPPLNPKTGKDRLYFDSLRGATVINGLGSTASLRSARLGSASPGSAVVMTDPDGRDFRMLTPR